MKIRKSFVSNSSSASFIVDWTLERDDLSLEETLNEMFLYCHDKEEVVSDILKNTALFDQRKAIGKWTCQTNFYTNMMNSYSDFGIAAAYLVLFLTMQKHKEPCERYASLMTTQIFRN